MGKPKRKSPRSSPAKAAGYFDVSEWGDKDASGAYPPGTMLDLGDGKPIDLSRVPDLIGESGKRARRPAGRAPTRDGT